MLSPVRRRAPPARTIGAPGEPVGGAKGRRADAQRGLRACRRQRRSASVVELRRENGAQI